MADSIFPKSPLDRFIAEAEGYEPPQIPSPQATNQPAAARPLRSNGMSAGLMPPPDLQSMFEEASAEFGVPVNVLAAMAQQESSYNPRNVNTSSMAKGLFQYMEPTANALGINPFDARQSTRAAAMQLRERLDKGETLQEAIAHHHAGPNRKQWGPKTEQYVESVLGKAGEIGKGFMQNAPKAEAFDPAAIQAELDAKEPGRYKVLSPEEAERYQRRSDLMQGQGQLQAAQDALKPGAPSPLTIDNQQQYAPQSAPSPLTVQNQQRVEAGMSPQDTRPYQGFLEATGNALSNVPERFQQSIAGLIQMAGEDLGMERERFIADRARQYGITPGDMKLLAWAGNQSLIDPKMPIPEALQTVKQNIAQSLNDDQLKQLSAAGIVNPDEITAYAKQWRKDTKATMAEVRSEPGSMAYYGSAAIASLAEMGPMIAGAIITRSPAVAMGIMGGQVGGQAYAEGRERGLDEEQAQTYAVLTAAAEAVPEALVVGRLLKPGAGAVRKVLEGSVLEGAQEAVTAALQAGIDQQMIEPDMTLREALVRIRDGAIIGALAGGGMGAITAGADAVANRPKPAPQERIEPTVDGAAPTAEPGIDGATPAAEPAATTPPSQAPATPAAEVPEQVAPAPVNAAPPQGPLSRSAAKAAPGPRVVVAGETFDPITGELLFDRQDSVTVRTDTGELLEIPREDINAGMVAIQPEAAAVEQPPVLAEQVMPEALQEIPPQPVEQPAPRQPEAPEPRAPEQPAPRAPEPSYEDMSEPELRARMKYLAGQAKANGGWDKLLTAERKKVEKAISALVEQQQAASQMAVKDAAPAAPEPVAAQPAADQTPVKWFGTQEKADAFIAKKGMADTHEVVPVSRSRFEIREKADQSPAAAEMIEPAAVNQQVTTEPAGPQPGQQVTLGKGRQAGTVVDVTPKGVKVQMGTSVELMSLAQFNKRLVAAEQVIDAPAPVTDAPVNTATAPSIPPAKLAKKAKALREKADRMELAGGDPQVIKSLREQADRDQPAEQPAASVRLMRGDWVSYPVDADGNRATGEIVEIRGKNLLVATDDGARVTVPRATAEYVSKVTGGNKPADQGPSESAAVNDYLAGRRDTPPTVAEFEAEQKAKVPDTEAKPVVSENKIFTEDAAEKARALLRSKLTQLNSGIDPEIMQAGITLAGYHIEKGARTFAAYADAMLADLGEIVRPYLKSWYMGVKYDPRAAGFDGMSSAAEVESFNVDEVQRDTETTEADAGADAAAEQPGRVQADGQGRPAGAVPAAADGRVRGERGERTAGRAEQDGRAEPEAGRPADDVRGDRGTGAQPDRGADRRNYRIAPGELTRTGSWKSTAEQNVRIVELVKQITAEGRQATPEEKAQLTKFTGWGASEIANGIFPNQYGQYKDGWRELGERLKAAMTPEEYAEARRTTQYAHYTSEPVIRSVYSALERMGFNGGQVLEPGMGVGLFNGLMPEGMAGNSQYTGIEYDTITGNIAKLLYPESNIIVGDFTQTKLPRDFFDAAIGNPPFGQIKIQSDPEYKKQGFLLHDYFFAKTIDRVKPGGLLVFVTSKGTMDKANDRARKYLAERADLLGAIRLPQTAFKGNAGTEVVTDVIFLRKRREGEAPAGESWQGLAEVATAQGPAYVNEYFAAHPEMVLGRHAKTGSMYRADEYTVEPIEGNIEDLFAKAVQNLPEGIYRPERGSQAERAAVQRRDYDPKVKKEGGVYVADDGSLMQVEDGQGVPLTSRLGSNGKMLELKPREVEWLKGYTAVRDALKQAQYDQLNEGPWEKSLKALNKAYDDFTKKHGPILAHSVTERENEDGSVTVTRRFKNQSLIYLDAEGALAYALEEINPDGSISKAPVLKGRTLNKPATPRIATVQDAMFVSLNDTGRFDLADIARLAGKTEQEVVSELGDAIYEDPSAGWTTADEYLSGNVVRKLKEAEAAARLNKALQRNVEALKNVQPRALAPQDITVQLGSAWVPASDVKNFAAEVLGESFRATYSPTVGQWGVDGSASRVSEWGIPQRNAAEILEAVLNNRALKITYRDAEGKTHTDTEATEKANDIAKKMRSEFKRWIWSDTARADRLAKFYNENYNNIAPRQFDGSHLTLPGVSSRFNLRPHQKRAIWRTIQQGDTYYAHAVGAGKTFTMIAAGMEERRLGLSKKPMYVVPNHMLAQFSKEFLELYPTASIMVADEQNFHTHNRRKFVAQAALNDPDAIVITHSAFGRIGMSPEYTEKFIRGQIDDWQAALEEADKQDRVTVKQIERRIEQLENRLKAIIDSKKDQVLTFEELGVDRLYVDEGHEFRKLDFPTNRGNIKGIDPSGSQRAMDLYMKVQYLREKNPNRALVMASGTPITNTMGELFTVQRYFQPAQLEEDGDDSFDMWANHYGEVVEGLEQNAAGGYETVSRFAKFVNVPELMSRVRSFMDILTSPQLGDLVQRPDVDGGGRQVVVTPIPDGYKEYQKTLEARIKAIRNRKGPPKAGEDIILNVIADGRFSAIDMRFVDPSLPSDPKSKLNVTLDEMIHVYNDTAGNEYATGGQVDTVRGGSLMLFTDIGLGEQSAKSRGFDMKVWIEKRLIEGGVKPEHIAFMRDHKAHAKKERLFDDLRQGRKRILIGGKDMETGVNAQKRLVWLGHLDAPWFPASVEQREGRIIRQGNQNKRVAIQAFATKGSYDSTMWGMNARKARFIEQAMSGDTSVRSMDDVSEASAFEMAAALASGDERYMKLAGLKGDVERLSRLYSAHMDEQRRLRSEKMGAESAIKHNEEKIAAIQAVLPQRVAIKAGAFSAKAGNQAFDSREQFSEAVFARFKELAEGYTAGDQKLGELGGFPVMYRGIEMRGGSFAAELSIDVPTDPDPLAVFPVDPDISVAGIATRAANAVNGLDAEIGRREANIAEFRSRLEKIERRLGASFPEASELAEKREALAELEQELEAESKAAEAAAAEAAAEIEANEVEQPIKGDTRYSIKDGVPQAEFGPVSQVASVADAVERLMADQNGEAIVPHKALGEISIVYGNGGMGLAHIAKRRGESFMRRLPDLIENGALYTKPGQAGRVFLGNDTDEAAIRLDWSGEAKTWLVSAYEKYPELQPATAPQQGSRSQVVAERTGKPMSPEDVRQQITKGVFGDLVNRMIGNGMIVIHSTSKTLPNGMGKGKRGIQAVTEPNGTVHLVANNLTPETTNGVLLHEMFHSGTEALVGSKRWGELMGRLGSLRRQAEQSSGKAGELLRRAESRVQSAKAQGAIPTRMENEEFGAYLIEEYEIYREAMPSAFRRWVDDLLGAIQAYMFSRYGKQIGKLTARQLRALAKDALLVKGIARRGDLYGPKAEWFSVAPNQPIPTEAEIDGWLSRKLTDAMAGPKSKGQYNILSLAPMDRMVEELAGDNAPAQEYLKLKRAMDAYRTRKHSEFDTIAQDWLKLNVKNRKAAKEMAELMHESTIAQTDPAERFKSILTERDRETINRDGPESPLYPAAIAKQARDQQRKIRHAELKARFDALPTEFQAKYRQVRDIYQAMAEELDQILIDNMSKAIDMHGRKAERTYYKELERIRDDGLTGAEKAEAEAKALKKFNTAMTKLRWNKRARMTQMRQQFESNRLEGPYFPLARFGDLFVTVRDRDTGEVISFSRFENSTDQQRFAKRMARFGVVETGLLSNSDEIRGAVDPRFVSDVESILEGAEIPDSVKDQVWQRYLESMPDLSLRKGFIHRKGRAGYSQDALRAFASRMFHGAHQLGRLKYGQDMQEQLDLSRDAARATESPERDTAVINELERRHQYVMNPKGSAFAQHLTSAAFIWQLSMSPAAALVNVSQTVMIGVPILGAQYGMDKAGAQLLRAMKDFTKGYGRAERANLGEDEKAALRDAYETGLIESTQSHNLAGVGETGVEYSAVRNRVMGVMAWAYHQAERFNREVTFLAAYRLAKAAGMDQQAAIDEGARLTWKTHFDYGNTNRPRAMHGDAAKVALIFRNYQINMLWRLFRDAHQAVNAEGPARTEAIKQLAGITGLMALSAGIRGTWLFGLGMVLASLIFGDDAEEKFKKGAVELLGPTMGGFLLNGVPGHATGLALSERIGMPDLWFRSPDRQLEGQDEFNYWMTQLLGYLPSMAGNIHRGFSMAIDGEGFRGVETASPKFVKDLMRAARFADEGVQTLKGEPLVDRLTFGEVAAQALGFTPAVVAEQYERNNFLKNAEQRIMDERRKAMDSLALAIKLEDAEAKASAEKAIKAYNEKYPDYPITGNSIRQSLRSRAKTSARTEGGVVLNPRLNERLRGELGPALYK